MTYAIVNKTSGQVEQLAPTKKDAAEVLADINGVIEAGAPADAEAELAERHAKIDADQNLPDPVREALHSTVEGSVLNEYAHEGEPVEFEIVSYEVAPDSDFEEFDFSKLAEG